MVTTPSQAGREEMVLHGQPKFGEDAACAAGGAGSASRAVGVGGPWGEGLGIASFGDEKRIRESSVNVILFLLFLRGFKGDFFRSRGLGPFLPGGL